MPYLVRYQHDTQQPVVEVSKEPGEIQTKIHTGKTSYDLRCWAISQVDSRLGGWAEVWTEDGKTLLHCHPRSRREERVN